MRRVVVALQRQQAGSCLLPRTPCRGIRQHANPFSPIVVGKPELPVFTNPSLPIHMDLGTGDGSWLAALAARQPSFNHIGTEIRAPVVERAQGLLKTYPIIAGNTAFLRTNFTLSHASWFPEVLAASTGGLQLVSVCNPDPNWKGRHAKRRMLSPQLLAILAGYMPSGARLYLQTDRPEVFEDMHAVIGSSGSEACWDRLEDPTGPYLGVHSSREARELQAGATIYRALYARTSAPPPPVDTATRLRYRLGAPPPQRGAAATGVEVALDEDDEEEELR